MPRNLENEVPASNTGTRTGFKRSLSIIAISIIAYILAMIFIAPFVPKGELILKWAAPVVLILIVLNSGIGPRGKLGLFIAALILFPLAVLALFFIFYLIMSAQNGS